jgi:uncharacterized protein (TIGR03546 family)
MGITPKVSVHNLVILMACFFLNINGSAVALSAAAFTLFSYLFDPLFNRLGYGLLTAPQLHSLWTSMYNTPGLPWTKFNNTLVLGSLASALALFLPIYLASIWLIVRYREVVVAQVQKWKLVQILRASKLYSLYENYTRVKALGEKLK